MVVYNYVFFFKQKTAYELRISDWSSDVCSSDLVPIPVDKHGMCLPSTVALNAPKFIFVTPSHQYPLGMVMSLERRRRLIRLARQWGSWKIGRASCRERGCQDV